MNTLILIALMLMSAARGGTQQQQQQQSPQPAPKLPELHAIKTVTLSPSYSCRTQEEAQKGYQGTALFLSAAAQARNSPALLFNGACRSPDFFQVSMAGADMSVIADLGEGVELEGLTAQDFHGGIRRGESDERRAMQFRVEAPVKLGHTYALILNKGDFRGLLFFTVKGHLPNERLDLSYVVKHYESLTTVGQSPGFDWTKRNSQQ